MDARSSIALQEVVVVTLGLGCEEATDTHRYGACNELGYTPENDELGFPERGKASGQRKRHR